MNFKNITAASIVSGAAFIASAGHIVQVVSETNPVGFALVYPIGIDGLIFVGIRALQAKRFVVGATALLIGAFYSLAFNGHAEGAFHMPPILIASSMPIAMFAAFLIEATQPKAEQAPAAPVERTETEWDRMTERVEMRLRAEHALHIEEMKAEFERKFAAIERPEPIHVETIVRPKPEPKPVAKPIERPAITSGTPGRKTGWDVEKAVGLIADGRTDADVMAAVDGLGAKPLQRTRRAIRLIEEDASRTDETIREIMKSALSIEHIARVRAAMK